MTLANTMGFERHPRTLLTPSDRHRDAVPVHIQTRTRALRDAMFGVAGPTECIRVEGRVRIRDGHQPPALVPFDGVRGGDDEEGVAIRSTSKPRVAAWSFYVSDESPRDILEHYVDRVIDALRAQPWAQAVCCREVLMVFPVGLDQDAGFVGRATVEIHKGAVVGVKTDREKGEPEAAARAEVQALLRDAMDLPNLRLAEGRSFDDGNSWWFGFETFEVEGDGAVPDEWFAEMRDARLIPRSFDDEALVLARAAASAVRAATAEWNGFYKDVVLTFEQPVQRLDGTLVERLALGTAPCKIANRVELRVFVDSGTTIFSVEIEKAFYSSRERYDRSHAMLAEFMSHALPVV